MWRNTLFICFNHKTDKTCKTTIGQTSNGSHTTLQCNAPEWVYDVSKGALEKSQLTVSQIGLVFWASCFCFIFSIDINNYQQILIK